MDEPLEKAYKISTRLYLEKTFTVAVIKHMNGMGETLEGILSMYLLNTTTFLTSALHHYSEFSICLIAGENRKHNTQIFQRRM